MNDDDPHMTIDALMIHLRTPATWYEKTLAADDVLALEKLLFLILAMVDCGVPLYELTARITKIDE